MQALARVRPVRVSVNWYAVALASLAAAGVALRFWGLANHNLDYDETFTMLMTGRSLPDMLRAAAGDVHPPLSYLMYWLFVRLAGGPSILAVRLPGAIIGSLSIWQMVQLMRRLRLSRPVLLAGLALFALSPMAINYSQNARMYALLLSAVLGMTLALLERRYWLMAVWMSVALWTHNYGLIYSAVIGLAALWQELGRPALASADPALGYTGPEDASRVKQVIIAGALALASWLPWAGVLAWQMRALSSGYWIEPLTLGGVIYPIFPLLWGVALPTDLNGIGAAVGIGLVLFALLKAIKLRRFLLIWLALAPALIAAGVSLVTTPIYLFRGLIGCLPALLLLIAIAVVDGTSWRERAWTGLLVGTLLLLAVWYRLPLLERTSADNAWALQVVLNGYQPGDVVFHGNVGTISGFETMGPAWLPNFLMTVQPGSVGVLTPETRRALGFCEGDIEPGQLVTNCGRVSWRRAWLVWGASQTISGTEDAAIAAILARYPHVKMLDIHDVYHGGQPVDGGIWLLTNEGQQ